MVLQKLWIHYCVHSLHTIPTRQINVLSMQTKEIQHFEYFDIKGSY